MLFIDRKDAGTQLGHLLQAYRNRPDAVVCGLARGGVIVAIEVAKALNLGLSVLVPRKIGAPTDPELAIGALAEDGTLLIDNDLAARVGATHDYVSREVQKEAKVALDRLQKFRAIAPLISFERKIAILVDDGIATGATMLVEIASLRKLGASRVIAAAPIAGYDAWQKIKKAADEAIAIVVLGQFLSISQFYKHFEEVTTERALEAVKGFSSFDH